MSALSWEEMDSRGLDPEDWSPEQDAIAQIIVDYLDDNGRHLHEFSDDLPQPMLADIDRLCGGFVMDDFTLDSRSVWDEVLEQWLEPINPPQALPFIKKRPPVHGTNTEYKDY